MPRAECAEDGCRRWGYTAATHRRVAVGWYLDRDGSVLYPDHLPAELADFMRASS